MPLKKLSIKVGARSSPLSRAQVAEVAPLISADFEMKWVETVGDLDRSTSLRTLGKTDFFTKDLDDLLLRGEIRVAIHSAKDLPEPLPKGLCIAAVTKSLDVRDALVFDTLPENPVIATSSERREMAVRALYPNASFIDLRGTIHERLEKIKDGAADGVVVAEVALVRLNLSHLNRVYLPGPTTEGQGSLAIVCRKEDLEMIELFSCIKSST